MTMDGRAESGALLLRRVRPMGGPAVDLLIRDGRIAASGSALAAEPGVAELDGADALALPGLVDAHAHIDKTLWGLAWHSNLSGPRVADRISYERRVLGDMALPPAARSGALLRHMAARGTTHVRSHVDIGPDIGLRHLEAILALRERWRGFMDIQIVAFPQTGVMIHPGTLDLLDAAIGLGAEVIGGLDPCSIDRDPKGQLDGIFAIADRRGVGVDIHLHDRGELGAFQVELIAERTRALGLKGRVAISHAFCLGGVEEAQLAELIGLLADNDIAIMTHGPMGSTPFPPIRRLHDAGIRLFTGSDGVRDAWGPLNTGDMLERAFLLAYRSNFRDDSGLALALDLATFGGARVIGAAGYGLAVGDRADLVLVDARTVGEAVVAHGPRSVVLKGGRVIARAGAPSPDLPGD